MAARSPASDLARHQLARRLGQAVAGLDDPATPLVVVDLDAFDANAADLVRRAAGKPVRVASKSLRVPALVRRALAVPGFAGVLAYSLREALWLVREGVSDDVVMGYPSVDRGALRSLLADARPASRSPSWSTTSAQLDLLDSPARVALDVDAGLKPRHRPRRPQALPAVRRRRASWPWRARSCAAATHSSA